MNVKTRLLAAAAGLALLCHAAAHATPTTAAGPVMSRPVVIPGTKQIDFVSKINGQGYRLFVAPPLLPPPPGGYPVLYVLDGNGYFGTAVETARLLSYAGDVRAAVVVGIGYPTDDLRQVAKPRARDLTLPAPTSVTSAMPGMTAADVGGLDAFLNVIDQEIKPSVAATASINQADSALFGHSLGGLAVLRALFQHPAMFRTFIAASPSIFWNDRAVLADEAAFVRQVEAGMVAPRVLIEVGGAESTELTSIPASSGLTLEKANAQIRMAHMVDEARDLAERLGKIKAKPEYHVTHIVFKGENHQSVPPAAISRAVRFAFGNE